MIKITGLKKKMSSDFTLKIDDLTIEKGERVALIGPNGSGKSTLLRLIAGILKPDGGEISLPFAPAGIGYQPQSAFAFSGTAEYNVKLGARENADINAVIAACGLENVRKKRVSALSGGERQRTCFARMMAGSYPLLLLDEPFSALDIEYSARLSEYLKAECEKNGTTLLISTHLPSQALSVATKVLIMNNGTVCDYADVSRLTSPESDFGKKFIEQWRIH